MTVGELLTRISSKEISEWYEYYALVKDEEEKQAKELDRKSSKGKGRGKRR